MCLSKKFGSPLVERMGDLWKRGGLGGSGAKGNAAASASADVLEQQNEALLGSLQSKIAAMKQVRGNIIPLCTKARMVRETMGLLLECMHAVCPSFRLCPDTKKAANLE